MFCDAAKTAHADFAGVTEANIDFTQPEVRYFTTEGARSIDRCCKIVNRHIKHNFLRISNPEESPLFSFRRLSSRHAKHWSDSSGQGRWVINTFSGNHSHNLAIITTYQVHFSSPTGPTSIRTQRQMISNMDDPEADIIDIRESYWTDIGNVIKTLKDDNHLVILMGDFNESLFGGRRHALQISAKNTILLTRLQRRSNTATRLRLFMAVIGLTISSWTSY